MKIAAIFFSLNVRGGSASVFLSLANELQNKGHEVDVYCYYFNPKKCFPELTKSLNLKYLKLIDEKKSSLNNQSLINRLRLAVDYYLKAPGLYKLMKDEKYDVIFASEACAYVPALIYTQYVEHLARHKKKRKVPVFWSVFDPISLVDKKRPGLLLNRYPWFARLLKIHNFFDSKKISKIDKVIVPTRKMKERLDQFYKISCEIIPTAGVRPQDYAQNQSELAAERLKEKFGFEKTNESILFSLGHFLPHRRYEDTLYALDLLIRKGFLNFKYIISGSKDFDPVYFSYIRNLISSLKLDHYVILDESFKTAEEVISYYQYCDIFLFVSVEQTWGLAPFEALAAGKPVIISRGVGGAEVFNNGENAIIVAEKSPPEIAAAIRLLQNKELYNSLARQGKSFVEKEFNYGKIIDKIEKCFDAFITTSILQQDNKPYSEKKKFPNLPWKKIIIFGLPVLFILNPILKLFQNKIWLAWGYPNHYFNLIDQYSSPFYLWKEVTGESGYPYLFNIIYYWLFKLLVVITTSPYISWLIYVCLIFAFSIFFFSLYVKRLDKSLSWQFCSLLGLLYASYFPLNYEGFNLRIAAVLIPFLLWILIKIFENSKQTVPYCLLFSIFTLNLIIVEPRAFIAFLFLAASHIAFWAWKDGDKKRIMEIIIFFAVALAGSLILFLPIKYSQDIALNNSMQISVPVQESVLTRFFSPFKILFHPHTLIKSDLATTACLLFLLSLILIGCYKMLRERKKTLFLILLLMITYFLFLNDFFLRELTMIFAYGQLFRTWRIAQYLAMFLIPLSLIGLANIKKGFLLLAIFALSYFSFSVYTFNQNMTFVKKTDIDPYIKANEFLAQDKENFKILWTPEMGWFGENSGPFWVSDNNPMQGFPENISSKPTYWHYTNQITHFYTWLSSGIWKSQIQESENASNLLGVLGIKYLIVHDDVPGYRQETTQIINNLSSLEDFALVWQKDYLYIFENLNYRGRIWATPQEKTTFCDYGLECLADLYDKTGFDQVTGFVSDTALNSISFEKVKNLFQTKNLKTDDEEKFYNLIVNKILADAKSDSIILFSKDYFKYQDYTSCLSDTHHGTYHDILDKNELSVYANSFGPHNCFFLLAPYYPNISFPVSVSSGEYVILIRYMKSPRQGSFNVLFSYFNYKLNSFSEKDFNYYAYFKDELKIHGDAGQEIRLLNEGGVNFISLIALIPKKEFEDNLAFLETNLVDMDGSEEFTGNNPVIEEVTRISPSRWQVKLFANKPFVLTFAESYNPSWKVTVFKDSTKQEEQYPTRGYAIMNSFFIDATGNLELEIIYEPQKKYYQKLLFSILSFGALIGAYYFLQKLMIHKFKTKS